MMATRVQAERKEKNWMKAAHEQGAICEMFRKIVCLSYVHCTKREKMHQKCTKKAPNTKVDFIIIYNNIFTFR